MRINAISPYVPVRVNLENKIKRNDSKINLISMSDFLSNQISFCGQRNNKQAIFYGAEVAPYSKAGGVGVVMKDYATLLKPEDEIVVSPYYRANLDKETGVVTPLVDKDGDYILKTNHGDKKLNLVAKKQMQWGKKTDSEIMLFNLKDENPKVHYFVFDDSTAHFTKPYENIPVYKTGAKQSTNEWHGDPYAKNSKAFVELLPEIIDSKPNFNPGTIVCSDSQTAYTHEYMVQKNSSNNDSYDGIKTTHVGHNLGPGYCGETSMQNMFVNLGATPKQIELIENDPIFQDRSLGDNYFKPFVKNTLDSTGTASATQIAINHATPKEGSNNYVKSFSVVAEDYAESIANNPQAAHNIQSKVKPLYDKGIFNGIMNPLEDTSVDATKKLPNELYNVECKDTDGTTHEPFKIYPENVEYKTMREIKNSNKANLLKRLSANDTTIITGNPNRTAKINPEAKGVYDGPVIKPELINMIENGQGDSVPLFISWGRIDTQKGHNISLSAFEKFAKTPEGKNAIFILGGGLDKSDESKIIEEKIKTMLADPDLQGRIVHIDGWAPAYALSSAADAAIFTSRFEPCGLTDIEAMKYYCTPIVTNTQGFKQKNFDPRIKDEAQKATSLKSRHEFNLLSEDINLILKAYNKGDADAIKKVKEEFPDFYLENGEFDDTIFVEFAEEYTKFYEKALKTGEKTEEELKDWDSLSKDFNFKYKGFARDFKDGILAQEIYKAISDFSQLDTQTKELMFNNLKNLDTSWRGNANLHPSGKSSADLYIERHLMPEYSAPKKTDSLQKTDDEIADIIEKRQEKDIENRAQKYSLAALAGVAGILTGRGIKNASNLVDEIPVKGETIQQLENQIKTLTSKIDDIVKSNKKNIIIAGVASFILGGLVSLLIAKLNKAKSNEQITQNVNNTQQTKLFYSFEDYRNNTKA